MSQETAFRAVIEEGRGGGAFVTVPFDVEAAFGKKRVSVRATIDDRPYRGSLVRMGGPDHILGVLKEIRAKIGKRVGDEVYVVLGGGVAQETAQWSSDHRPVILEYCPVGGYLIHLVDRRIGQADNLSLWQHI